MKCQHCQVLCDSQSKYLKCGECKNVYHLKCLSKGVTLSSGEKYQIHDSDYDFIVSTKASWKCPVCAQKKLVRGDDTPVKDKPFDFSQKEPGKSSNVSTQSSANNSDSDVSGAGGVKSKILCNKCDKGFSHNAHRAECFKCNKKFHFKCTGYGTKEAFAAKKTPWFCDVCTNTTTVEEIESNLENLSIANITLEVVFKEMRSLRMEITSQNKDIKDSMNKYSEWIVENTSKINVIDGKITALVSDFDILKQEICDLKKTNGVLISRLNYLEQSVKDKDIEIHGIPLKNNEDILSILESISNVIGFGFDKKMIDNCYRYKQSGMGRGVPGITVRFLRRLDKESFIEHRRKKRNLNSRDLGFMEEEASPIYVNESLTSEKRKLLNAARQAKREKLFTFLWVKNGRIFMRKNEGDRFVVIDSYDDINKLN